MKYIVLKSWSDYDCGAPCAGIVNDRTYDTWQEAYDVIVKDILNDYDVTSLDEVDGDYKLPDRDKVGSYIHKCGNALVSDGDGETLYNIQMIKVQNENQK